MSNVRRVGALIGLVLALSAAPAVRGEDDPVLEAEKALQSGDWTVRLKAVESLEAAGTGKAARVLVRYLADLDWAVQVRACQAAGKLGGEELQEGLRGLAVSGEIHRVREAALESLGSLKATEAGERLLKNARSAKKVVEKARGIEAAGRLAAPDLLPKFREYVHHKEELVAAAAARALGWLGKNEAARAKALELLEEPLGEREAKDFGPYAGALEALIRIGGAQALSRLVREVLLQEDDDGYVPTRVARALAAAGAEAAAAAIQERLAEAKDVRQVRRLARLVGECGAAALRGQVEAWATHKDPRVRSTSVRSLGRLGDAASLPVLTTCLGDGEVFVRVEAVSALAATAPREAFRGLAAQILKDASVEVRLRFVVDVADQGDAEGIAALTPFLSDEDWRVASASAASVGTLGIAEDLPLLEPLLTHKSWKIRAAALEGTGRLRAIGAIPHLARGLEDKDPVVRGVCLANLQILTKQKLGTKPDRWLDWHAKESKDLVLIKRSRRTKEEIEVELKREEEEDKAARYKHEKDEVTQSREARKRNVEILQKARILVVSGAWDHVERVLGHLAIPHTLLRAQELKEAGLNPNQVILVNCEGTVDKDSMERLRWFVNVGGYLMATDWALTHTIEPCFPGYVAQFSGSSTGNDVVVVEEAQPGHPWTKGIFDDVPALKWWLEIQAFPITVTYPERCNVLVDSAEMRRRYGSSPMAAEFRWGLGKVQHSISHFFLQEEGMQQTTDPRQRMIFAADHLGISLAQIRNLSDSGRFAGQLNEETMKEIAPDYSMFRLIVHVVREKALWVENL
jgi:HEAT repeat protein